jgi:hypothetical protein
MSYPTFGVNDAMAVKHWSKLLSMSARDTTLIAPFWVRTRTTWLGNSVRKPAGA